MSIHVKSASVIGLSVCATFPFNYDVTGAYAPCEAVDAKVSS